ncbi:hypothetical protein VOLCADRAFT_89516 [Volvox carteri f. nagariensis]|uniref:Uncharacterized protein n=1 Tax=Volvox carteri f. nagariensis TaxID=3068 RepID=D8TS19_VOLCA|nr:uncharacterized protein VOLCADRAFT_89516 [Volvox carteri f. nagariensis]EFJ49615.1 hypothetical protein VOLCADRAFT_89516 [Volvox carteri f. nagariensis]|eukprot:XP_002949122.1 hypothetical protein VOLCADRAFT_89516 [Volvox carteri f. nagariensis]
MHHVASTSRGPARPPSGALSGWEDDSPHPGAELLEYLGKAHNLDSDASTPWQAPSNTSDPSHALLATRVAVEGSANATGDTALARKSSLKSQSSGGSYAGRAENKSRLARGRGSPANSTSPLPPGNGDQQPALPTAASTPAMPETAAAELKQRSAVLFTAPATPEGEARPEGSLQASWSPDPEGGEGGGVSGAEADRLRGLLYSDDEDGGDDDYQDLMTADDDALFGGVEHSGGGGAGKGGRKGGGRNSRTLAPTGASSTSAASGAPRLSSCGGESMPDLHTAASSSVVTTASGDGNADMPAGRTGEAAVTASLTAAGIVSDPSASPMVLDDIPGPSSPRKGAGSGDANDHDPNTSLPPGQEGCTSPVFPSWAAKGDGALGLPGPSFRGPATEALERVLSGRVSGSGTLGPGPLGSGILGTGPLSSSPRMSPPLEAADHEPVAAAAALQGQGHSQVLAPHHFPNAGSHHHHYQQHHQQYVSIPTPQIGEGLRQHPPPPPRRLYLPGQSNRSPVRGSGYVVSHASVRTNSPSKSPSRGLHSAVNPHHTALPQASVPRRLSSPSITLGNPSSHRSRSPRESNASAASTAGAAFHADGDEFAIAPGGTLGGLGIPAGSSGAAGNGTGLSGSVLKMGSWVTGTAAGNGGVTGMANGGNFPGGQVYRSTPISQVSGSSSEEMMRMEALGGAGGGAGAGPVSGGSGGLGQGTPRGGGSPGRLSARPVRQPRAAVASSSGGPAGAAGGASSYAHDRFGGSFSAPTRPSTSPHKPRSSGTARSSGLVSVGTLSSAAATSIFSNGAVAEAVDAAAAAAAAIAAATAPPSRGIIVPALPPYPAAHGIRHCGFKQAVASPVSGGAAGAGSVLYAGNGSAAAAAVAAANSTGASGAFGSTFSSGRPRAGAGIDDRLRPPALNKILSGVGLAAGPNTSPQEHTSLLSPYVQPLSPRGGADAFGGGSVSVADTATAGATAATAETPSSHPQSQPQLYPHHQQQLQGGVQRKGSLPHLPPSSESQPPSGPSLHGLYGAAGVFPQPYAAAGTALTLFGRTAAGRNGTIFEQGLPSVQVAPPASGIRSLSFDTTRRATPRA